MRLENTAAVEMLLDAGAPVNEADLFGRMPVDWVVAQVCIRSM